MQKLSMQPRMKRSTRFSTGCRSKFLRCRDIHSKTSQLHEKFDRLVLSQSNASLSSMQLPAYPQQGPPYEKDYLPGEDDGTIRMRASCYRKSCRPWCSCRCHIRRQIRAAGRADSFFGSLFIGYSGVPMITPPCNERQCRKRSSTRIILSYQFPKWFWSKSFFTSFLAATVAGPEMLIRVSSTIPFACETYQHCLNGNVMGLGRLLDNGRHHHSIWSAPRAR